MDLPSEDTAAKQLLVAVLDSPSTGETIRLGSTSQGDTESILSLARRRARQLNEAISSLGAEAAWSSHDSELEGETIVYVCLLAIQLWENLVGNIASKAQGITKVKEGLSPVMNLLEASSRRGSLLAKATLLDIFVKDKDNVLFEENSQRQKRVWALARCLLQEASDFRGLAYYYLGALMEEAGEEDYITQFKKSADLSCFLGKEAYAVTLLESKEDRAAEAERLLQECAAKGFPRAALHLALRFTKPESRKEALDRCLSLLNDMESDLPRSLRWVKDRVFLERGEELQEAAESDSSSSDDHSDVSSSSGEESEAIEEESDSDNYAQKKQQRVDHIPKCSPDVTADRTPAESQSFSDVGETKEHSAPLNGSDNGDDLLHESEEDVISSSSANMDEGSATITADASTEKLASAKASFGGSKEDRQDEAATATIAEVVDSVLSEAPNSMETLSVVAARENEATRDPFWSLVRDGKLEAASDLVDAILQDGRVSASLVRQYQFALSILFDRQVNGVTDDPHTGPSLLETVAYVPRDAVSLVLEGIGHGEECFLKVGARLSDEEICPSVDGETRSQVAMAMARYYRSLTVASARRSDGEAANVADAHDWAVRYFRIAVDSGNKDAKYSLGKALLGYETDSDGVLSDDEMEESFRSMSANTVTSVSSATRYNTKSYFCKFDSFCASLPRRKAILLRRSMKEYEARDGETLAKEGEKGGQAFVLIKGTITLYMGKKPHRQVTNAGEMIGLRMIAKKHAKWPFSVVAKSGVVVQVIHSDAYKRAVTQMIKVRREELDEGLSILDSLAKGSYRRAYDLVKNAVFRRHVEGLSARVDKLEQRSSDTRENLNGTAASSKWTKLRTATKLASSLVSKRVSQLPSNKSNGDAVERTAVVLDPNEVFDKALKYYLGDKDLKTDFKKAADYFRLASDLGHSGAAYNLALMYVEGVGVVKNAEIAAQYYKKSAELGCTEAMFNLAICLRDGDGTAVDPQEAVEWFRKAAKKGDIEALFCALDLQLTQAGDEVEEENVVKELEEIASNGHKEASLRLGRYYLSKSVIGSVENEELLAKAANAFERSAELGSTIGQFNIGQLYLFGKGREKDNEKATYWTKKAADGGLADAQVELGLMMLERCYSEEEVVSRRDAGEQCTEVDQLSPADEQLQKSAVNSAYITNKEEALQRVRSISIVLAGRRDSSSRDLETEPPEGSGEDWEDFPNKQFHLALKYFRQACLLLHPIAIMFCRIFAENGDFKTALQLGVIFRDGPPVLEEEHASVDSEDIAIEQEGSDVTADTALSSKDPLKAMESENGSKLVLRVDYEEARRFLDIAASTSKDVRGKYELALLLLDVEEQEEEGGGGTITYKRIRCSSKVDHPPKEDPLTVVQSMQFSAFIEGVGEVKWKNIKRQLKPRKVSRGACLCHAGNPILEGFILEEGTAVIKFEKGPAKKEVFVQAPTCISPDFVHFLHRDRLWLCTVVMKSDGVISSISRDGLRRCLFGNRAKGLKLLREATEQGYAKAVRCLDFVGGTVRQLSLSPKTGTTFEGLLSTPSPKNPRPVALEGAAGLPRMASMRLPAAEKPVLRRMYSQRAARTDVSPTLSPLSSPASASSARAPPATRPTVSPSSSIADGAFEAGMDCLTGRGRPVNLSLAAEKFRTAAKLGHAGALFQLGAMHLVGNGVPVNQKAAARYFELAAKSENVEAMVELARIHRNAEKARASGVEPSPDAVTRYYKMAADRVQSNSGT